MKTSALDILRHYSFAAAAGIVLFANEADAAVVSLGNGTVTFLEATYMPGTIVFKISTGDTNCTAGKYLMFISSNAETTKAVYATLLANMLSGRQAHVYYDDTNWNTGPWGNAACVVTNVGTH